MAKFRVQFALIEHHGTNGKNTLNDSVIVDAESEQTAIMLATSKVKTKSLAKGREVNVIAVHRM
ncbi:TPA: hypothetical protein ACGEYS_000768 [Kluyvera cryocrescens]